MFVFKKEIEYTIIEVYENCATTVHKMMSPKEFEQLVKTYKRDEHVWFYKLEKRVLCVAIKGIEPAEMEGKIYG